MSVATLEMYDWFEVHAETDALWRGLRDALRRGGIVAPDRLSREIGYCEIWERDDLVLGQACGLPYITELTEKLTLIGGLDFRLMDCPAGYYYSYIVVPKDAEVSVAELSGWTLATNGPNSQSGFGCLRDLGLTACRRLVTGAHRASIKAVAEGGKVFAAIDANSWRLAEQFEPAVAGVRILRSTKPTIGPALVAAKGVDRDAYRQALRVVPGFVPFERADYEQLL